MFCYFPQLLLLRAYNYRHELRKRHLGSNKITALVENVLWLRSILEAI